LFKEPNRAYIVEVIRVAQVFLIFVDDEDNRPLMEEVFEDELKDVISNFQKDKSLGPDFRREGRVLRAFNSTFIDLTL